MFHKILIHIDSYSYNVKMRSSFNTFTDLISKLIEKSKNKLKNGGKITNLLDEMVSVADGDDDGLSQKELLDNVVM
jgi:predicted CopG family antitoxin